MSERPQMAPALGLVRDRIAGPPPRRPTQAAPPETKPAAEKPAPAPEVDAPVREEEPAPEAPSTSGAKPKKTAARPKASSASTGGLKRTTISLPQVLAATMRERLQADRNVSQIQFILNAIETNAHRLKDLVEQERPAAATGGGLFPDQSASRVPVEERTTINLDTTEGNLRVIDSLVEQNGADSRSQLVRVALRAALAN